MSYTSLPFAGLVKLDNLSQGLVISQGVETAVLRKTYPLFHEFMEDYETLPSSFSVFGAERVEVAGVDAAGETEGEELDANQDYDSEIVAGLAVSDVKIQPSKSRDTFLVSASDQFFTMKGKSLVYFDQPLSLERTEITDSGNKADISNFSDANTIIFSDIESRSGQSEKAAEGLVSYEAKGSDSTKLSKSVDGLEQLQLISFGLDGKVQPEMEAVHEGVLPKQPVKLNSTELPQVSVSFRKAEPSRDGEAKGYHQLVPTEDVRTPNRLQESSLVEEGAPAVQHLPRLFEKPPETLNLNTARERRAAVVHAATPIERDTFFPKPYQDLLPRMSVPQPAAYGFSQQSGVNVVPALSDNSFAGKTMSVASPPDVKREPLFPLEPLLTVTGAPSAALQSSGVSVLPADITRQITQQAIVLVSLSDHEAVEIALNPKELGRVRMSMAMSENGITVSIMTERPETLQLLRRNIDLLWQDFRDIGFANINFSFGQHRPQHDTTAEIVGSRSDLTQNEAPDVYPVSEIAAAGASGLDIRV